MDSTSGERCKGAKMQAISGQWATTPIAQYEAHISLVARISAWRVMRGNSLDAIGLGVEDYRSELRIAALEALRGCAGLSPAGVVQYVKRAIWNRAKDLSRKNARERVFREKYDGFCVRNMFFDPRDRLHARNTLNQLASRISESEAACLAAYLFSGGVREAARDLGMGHSSYHRQFSLARSNAKKLLEAA